MLPRDVILLEALEALPLPAPSPSRAKSGERGPDYFVWRLTRKGRSLQVDVLACEEGPRGWREGERVPLLRLPEPGGSDWEKLGLGEQTALQAFRAWNRKPEGLPFALLAALEGHTRLSWAAAPGFAGNRVALARELSTLQVRAAPGGWLLSLSQRPGVEPVRLRLEGDRLLFTGFTAVHRTLDQLIGESRIVAQEMGSRLARALARLLPHLPLLTDLAPEPAPPDARPDRSLGIWARGGGERLDLQFFLEPAPGLPWQFPGEGLKLAIAGDPQARRLWRRDLTFECKRAEQVRSSLPPSAKPRPEPQAWRIEGRETVAGFLATLRDLGLKVRLEGVPGLLPRLPHRPELSFDVREVSRGLQVRGLLDGMPLESLLPALRQNGRFLSLEDGRILDLSELLGLRQLAAWAREAPGCLQVPRAAQAVLDRLRGGPMAPSPEQPPSGFMGALRPYQLEGFQWMSRLLGAGLGACLADDMGLGKTVQTAALLLQRANLGPALVVAPTSVTPNWRLELARFAPSLQARLLGVGDRAATLADAGPGDIVVASYGLLSHEGLQAVDWATAVLDEAHAIKNAETRRAQASRQLRTRARLALTGTPVENHPEELVSLMSWLLPDLEDRFRSAGDAATLKLLAAPFLLRRRKAEVLKELPPRTDLTVQVELEDVETTFHRELLARCRTEAESGGMLHLLAALMKLRRACAHPALVDPAYQGPAAKVDLLLDRLETLREEGHRSLVFSQFTDLLDLVQVRLVAAGLTFRRLDGTMSAKARQREVEAFQSGAAEVFLLSLRAGGTGLNLTAADDVFHLDPWWNPAVEDQASDRAHRMGRTRPVTVHRLIAAGTVEERVLALHERKRAMIENLLEGRDQAAALDRDTLESLLGQGSSGRANEETFVPAGYFRRLGPVSVTAGG